jgi:hypothetical protein
VFWTAPSSSQVQDAWFSSKKSRVQIPPGSHKTVQSGCEQHSGFTVLLNPRDLNRGRAKPNLERSGRLEWPSGGQWSEILLSLKDENKIHESDQIPPGSHNLTLELTLELIQEFKSQRKR